MENHRANEGCGYRILLVQNFRFCELFAEASDFIKKISV